jgi:hypothetical protein
VRRDQAFRRGTILTQCHERIYRRAISAVRSGWVLVRPGQRETDLGILCPRWSW